MATATQAKENNGTRGSRSGIDTGIAAKSRKEIAGHLVEILSDTYALMVKTHVYHWNVVGPLFVPLHELTEEHYTDMFAAVDVIAERIRALGILTPVSLAQLLKHAEIEEETRNRDAAGMVRHLVSDHESLVKRMREAALAADEADDLVTADMLTARLTFHEKAIWMLGAMIEV